MVDWSEQEVRIPSGPSEGRRYRRDRLPYASLLLNELGKWRRHVITGPTQSGKTLHAFVIVIMYYLFEMKEDVIVGLPDLNMAGVKWEKDIRPVIERSRYRSMMPQRGAGSQGGKSALITFRNGRSIHFMAGGGNDKQRAGATARVLVITETDGLDEVSETSKERQSKLSQLEGRVRAYGLDARIFMECTVTTEDRATWKQYMSGTQSRIVSPCPHCHAWVSPEREHLVGWDDAQTKVEAGKNAAFSCPECGILYSEPERRQMNLDSRLLHKGQDITFAGDVVGDVPETDTLGFRWSAFHNLLSPAELIGMEEWEAAQSEESEAADIALKQQVWCIPAEDATFERIPLTIGIVRGSEPGYHGRCNGRDMWSVPEWADCITAHVDVGNRVLDWSVCAHGGNLRDVIAYGATPTEQPDVIGPEEAILQGLHDVRNLIEGHCDLDLALVDCGYQGNRKKQKNPRRVVYEFVLSSGDKWQAAMGLALWLRKDESRDVDPSLTGAPWYYSRQGYLGQEVWVVDFDPNSFKHNSHGSYLVHPSTEDGGRASGSVTLFGGDSREHTDFAVQINNERFEIDHKTGEAKWKRHGPNHKFDNDVGNLVAKSVVDSMRLSRSQAVGSSPSSQPVRTPDGRAFFVGDR